MVLIFLELLTKLSLSLFFIYFLDLFKFFVYSLVILLLRIPEK